MKELKAKHILVKYLSSEASKSEKEQLYNWLQSKKNQALFKEFVKAEQFIAIKHNDLDSENAFNKFLAEVKNERKSLRRNIFAPYLKYAAILISAVISLFYFLNTGNSSITPLDSNQVTLEVFNGQKESILLEEDKVVQLQNGNILGVVKNGVFTHSINPSASRDTKEVEQNILKVPYGKTFKMILSDGSSVQLNSGSVLKYPNAFENNNSREVYLEGEAYFKVFKNNDSPFVVNTKAVSTMVYGTEFNVSAYKDNKASEVVLVEGSVGVKDNSDTRGNPNYEKIVPSQKASLCKGSKGIQITQVKIDKYVAWTKGKLMFDNDKFTQIIRILERRYNVQIENNYIEIERLRFTGNFETDSIEKILNTIKMHSNFSYEIDGEKITINKPSK